MYVVGLRTDKSKKRKDGNALEDIKVRVETTGKEKVKTYGKDYGWEEDLRNLDNNLPMHRIFEHLNKLTTVENLTEKDPRIYLKGIEGTIENQTILINQDLLIGRWDKIDLYTDEHSNHTTKRVSVKADTSLSRNHFSIKFDSATRKVSLVDEGSKRGTWQSVIDNVYEPFLPDYQYRSEKVDSFICNVGKEANLLEEAFDKFGHIEMVDILYAEGIDNMDKFTALSEVDIKGKFKNYSFDEIYHLMEMSKKMVIEFQKEYFPNRVILRFNGKKFKDYEFECGLKGLFFGICEDDDQGGAERFITSSRKYDAERYGDPLAQIGYLNGIYQIRGLNGHKLYRKCKQETEFGLHPSHTILSGKSKFVLKKFEFVYRNHLELFNREVSNLIVEEYTGLSEAFECSIFAIVDGFGDPNCKEFIKRKLIDKIREGFIGLEESSYCFQHINQAIMKAFIEVDRDYIITNPYDCKNSAAIINMILVLGHQIIAINLGNCRSFLVRGGEVIELTLKHEKTRRMELERLERSCTDNIIQKEKGFKFTRCFGMTDYKKLPEDMGVEIVSDFKEPYCNPAPEIWLANIKGNENFLLMGNHEFWRSIKIKNLFPLITS